MLALLALACLPVSAADEAKFEAVESRYLLDAEGKEWVKNMRSALAITQQKTGPFGLSQDPSAKKVTPKKVVQQQDEQAYAKAVAAMRVPIVMGNVFVIGSREFKKGQVFVLERKGISFNVEVISVSTEQIILKNVETGQQVIKQLGNNNVLKPDKGFEVDGVVPANQKDPGKVEVKD
ncbi:hypothetical protein HW115_04595 [Verrucomicrobiaceae bacterium N1E253]|uniref:Uncharacterized protein n=1 Tax=Oceaniferula marina TaxID=2748318 RepID=A0A851GI31_9BACT|nr:hypothetical protein [Oceaniferula marina]NWK54875.1 hypothetical protein [Oceaniferula marina]